MVPVQIALAMAARKRAAAIARVERTLQRRRNRALLAADIERSAIGILGHDHHAAVAEQPFHGIDG